VPTKTCRLNVLSCGHCRPQQVHERQPSRAQHAVHFRDGHLHDNHVGRQPPGPVTDQSICTWVCPGLVPSSCARLHEHCTAASPHSVCARTCPLLSASSAEARAVRLSPLSRSSAAAGSTVVSAAKWCRTASRNVSVSTRSRLPQYVCHSTLTSACLSRLPAGIMEAQQGSTRARSYSESHTSL
jgi:hypothetical protein